MENVLFAVLMIAVGLGLVLACAFADQLRRHGFEQLMVPNADGKRSWGRIFFVGAFICFSFAMAVSFID